MAHVAIIGTGYVGLTTAACLAHIGHHVTGIDIDESKIELLQAGKIGIYEPGLDDLVASGMQSGRLSFSLGTQSLPTSIDIAFICVPTPPAEDGSADLSYVRQAARDLADVLPAGSIVVCKSTVPVGSDRVVREAMGRNDIEVASNPEFLREGTAVSDFLEPDRVVVGADSPEVAARVAALYAGLRRPVQITDMVSAQMIKYGSNVFLAMKISFVNELAEACEALGADITEVTKGMGLDRRIGSSFLQPGPGWGGSCFPKDVAAMLSAVNDAGAPFSLLDTTVAVNDRQFGRIVDKACAAVGGSLSGARVAVWGLTFKANTDDQRQSPALEVIGRLQAAGAHVSAHDPTVTHDFNGIEVASDPIEACRDADVLVVLTEWPIYAAVDLGDVKRVMRSAVVVDARNLLDGDNARRVGIAYSGIGRR
jgi:UDPglucose 6-dehydrogenase